MVILQVLLIAVLVVMELVNLPLEWIRGVLLGSLCLLSVILLLTRVRFLARVKGMIGELKRATKGNSNVRLLANDDRIMNELLFSINDLIEQTAKMQVQAIKSEAARKSLLSNISHDIRTPLTSIIGYVDALQDDIASSREEKLEYLGIISRKANALKQLIDEIFQMAKLDADEIPLKPEIIDFAEIAREAIIEFLPEFHQYGLDFQAGIPEEKCLITADRLSLSRIISNLMKNAVQHGKDGKVVGIKLAENWNSYQLSIWDKGSGIAEDDLRHVFERMYRADRSRNGLDGGSGLGLAIARSLVEKQAGSIWAESIPGELTTFHVSFPKENESCTN